MVLEWDEDVVYNQFNHILLLCYLITVVVYLRLSFYFMQTCYKDDIKYNWQKMDINLEYLLKI